MFSLSFGRAVSSQADALAIEAGENGLEEGILHQLHDDFDGAHLGILEGTGDVRAGRHLLARAILQDAAHPAHHLLVHLADEGLVLSCSGSYTTMSLKSGFT